MEGHREWTAQPNRSRLVWVGSASAWALPSLLHHEGVARIAGLAEPSRKTELVVRALGAREIAHGIAILAAPRDARAVWSRVAGDVIDLFALQAGARSDTADRQCMLTTGAALLGITHRMFLEEAPNGYDVFLNEQDDCMKVVLTQ
jgi:threonine dehydrogenase-like Zn-dependent dehydrogenase